MTEREHRNDCESREQIETNLDVRTAAASGVIVIATLILMALAEKFAGLTQQMR